MDACELEISAVPEASGWVRLSLSGELDLSVAPWFEQRLMDEIDATDGVLLDLAGVDFIDSTGLALIMAGVRHAEAACVQFEFAQPFPAQARRLFEVSGLLPRLVLRGT